MPDVEFKTLPEDQFHAYRPEAQTGLTAELLVKVDGQGRLSDHFRVALASAGPVKGDFRGEELYPCANFHGYTFTVEEDAANIKLKQNCFTSKWADLEDWVASGRLKAGSADKADAGAEFRAACKAAKESGQPAAGAVRWMAQAHPVYGFWLVLQGLPATARALRADPRLAGDTCAAITLRSWIAETDIMEQGCYGPAPTLFSSDVEGTRSYVAKRPEKLKKGKNKC